MDYTLLTDEEKSLTTPPPLTIPDAVEEPTSTAASRNISEPAKVSPEPVLPSEPSSVAPSESEITTYAKTQDLPKHKDKYNPDNPLILRALHLQENPRNVPYGPPTRTGERAKGPFQFMQGTFDENKDRPDASPFNYADSEKAAQKYVSKLYNKYGDMKLTFAAYNAGPGVVDKYLSKTKNRTWEEVSDLMVANNAYKQTTDYVPHALAIFEGLDKNSDPNSYGKPAATQSPAPSNQRGRIGTPDQFKVGLGELLKDTQFQTGTTSEQIRALSDLTNSSDWTTDTYPLIKEASTALWHGASPEETPDFNDLVGAPPVVPKGGDVEKSLSEWRNEAAGTLRKSGINPNLMGKQFDDYLATASKDETEGFRLRNQGIGGYSASFAGRLGKTSLAGATNMVLGAAGGVVREVAGTTEFGARYADNLTKFGNDTFGTVIDNGFYKTDPVTKRVVNGPDGLPQAMWQAELVEGIAGIAPLVAGGAVMKAAGYGYKAITGANFGVNAFSVSNHLFKETYEKTGSVGKAYATSFAAIPEAMLMSMGEVGAIAGKFRPSLLTTNAMDMARFLAKDAANTAAINFTSGASASLVGQGALNASTGSPVSLEQAGIEGAIQAGGAAAAGGFFSYHGGKAEVTQRDLLRKTQVETTAAELNNFRYSLKNEAEIQGNVKDVDPSLLYDQGLVLKGETEGGFLVGKSHDITQYPVEPTTENLPIIRENIKNSFSPSELPAIKEKIADLTAKTQRTPEENTQLTDLTSFMQKATAGPEFFYKNVQANERALATVLENDPGVLPIKYDKELQRWENTETGETAPHAKDLLNPKETADIQDVSDISDLNVIREEDYLRERTALTERETELTNQIPKDTEAVSTLRDEVTQNRKALKEAEKSNAELEDQKLAYDKNEAAIKQLQAERDALGEVESPTPVSKEASEKTGRIQDELSKVQAEMLRLKNELQVKSTKAKRTQNKNLAQKERELKAQLLELKTAKRGESQSQKDFAAQEKKIARRNEIDEKLAKLQENHKAPEAAKDLADHKKRVDEAFKKLQDTQEKIRSGKKELSATKTKLKEGGKLKARFKKGHGSFTSKEKTITISKDTPQVHAHEVAHSIAEKIDLPMSVDAAINERIAELKDMAGTSLAKDVVAEAVLPDLMPTNIPEGAKGSILPKNKDNGVFDKKELMANQIAAVILKKQGKDIGNYKIIPEVEEFLNKKVKLPELFPDEVVAPKEAATTADSSNSAPPKEAATTSDSSSSVVPTKQNGSANKGATRDIFVPLPRETALIEGIARSHESVSALIKEQHALIESDDQGRFVPKKGKEEAVKAIDDKIDSIESKREEWRKELDAIDAAKPKGQETSTSSEAPPPNQKGPVIDARTGKKGETAYSETMGEQVPTRERNYYEKVSNVKGAPEAQKYVRTEGVENTLKTLEDPKLNIDPATRGFLIDATILEAEKQLRLKPTVKNADAYNRADQLRGTNLTLSAQALGLSSRFRKAETFGEYVKTLQKALREGGYDDTAITDFALKELEGLFSTALKLPGKLKDKYLMAGFKKVLSNKNETFGNWYKGFLRTNLLSGVVGTGLVNLEGGAFMGPLFLAMRHPILGRGIALKAMLNSVGEAKTNAMRVWETSAGEKFLGGLVAETPLVTSKADTMKGFYERFGDNVFKVYNSTDEFMRTLTKNGYLKVEQYKALQKEFGGDHAKFTAEASKLLISKDDVNAALAQARSEVASAGAKATNNDLHARAYEILKEGTPEGLIKDANDFADATSLKGGIANPLLRYTQETFFGPKLWENHPFITNAVNTVVPFGKAMLYLGDFSLDFIPGQKQISQLAGKLDSALGVKGMGSKGLLDGLGIGQTRPNAGLQKRFEYAQRIAPILSAGLFGMAASGLIEITGEEEIVLDRSGKGKALGKPARSGEQYKEFAQAGKPAFSVIIGDYAFGYKNIPGLSGILYGIHHAQKAYEGGEAVPYVAYSFYKNALKASIPLMGINSLSSPYIDIAKAFQGEDNTSDAVRAALEKFSVQAVKMNIPASSLLRDIQRIYSESPVESNATAVQQIFKDVPVMSELVGNRPVIDYFGENVQKTELDHVPGIGRIVTQVNPGQGSPVAAALVEKGIIIPGLSRTIKFNKSDFGSDQFQSTYTASREERLTKAYSDSFTPDEWYESIKANGPYIKQICKEIALSDLPRAEAQALLTKRVNAVREQSKKRYIRTGSF